MNISVRLFLGFFLVIGLAVWYAFDVAANEIEPGLRQATEETMVDASHLLAELAAPDLAAGRIRSGAFAAALRNARQRTPDARIYGIPKYQVDIRVMVTDADGIVRFDTENATVGEDFSHWKDIAGVLRGEYGVRTSRTDPNDPATSSMYVAAPILHEGRLIGVLSLAKPTAALQPYLQRAIVELKTRGIWIVLAATAIGVLFCVWLTATIHGLIRYARRVSAGEKAFPPTGGGSQFAELARSLADMRDRLEGKQYVERYVQNLAHEMKSPLTAVVSAAELLDAPLPEADRQRFCSLIREEAGRLHAIIERMLQLARVEQLHQPETRLPLDLAELVRQALAMRTPQLEQRHLTAILEIPPKVAGEVEGDAFLLQQAIGNLIDNAMDFSPEGGEIRITLSATGGRCLVRVRDQGKGAPNYALPHLFDRFYSLPHPATGRKSTGLGLPFVRAVARLHGGDAQFLNRPEGGAEVRLDLPQAQRQTTATRFKTTSA